MLALQRVVIAARYASAITAINRAIPVTVTTSVHHAAAIPAIKWAIAAIATTICAIIVRGTPGIQIIERHDPVVAAISTASMHYVVALKVIERHASAISAVMMAIVCHPAGCGAAST